MTDPIDRDRIGEAAARIAQTRLARRRLGPLPAAIAPRDLDEAYRVQDAQHLLLTEAGRGAIVGHKIGATTRVMQDYLRIDHPCAGGVFASTVHRSGVRLPYADFCRVGVECEVAVRLGRDLAPEDAPFDAAAVARAVDSAMAAIELVVDRYVDWRTLGTPTLIADDFFGAGSVQGEPVPLARLPELDTLTGRTLINGAESGKGSGADVMGHPFEALMRFANDFVARGRTLKAGEFVSTGSLTKTVWVAPGDTARIEISSLGAVEVVLTKD